MLVQKAIFSVPKQRLQQLKLRCAARQEGSLPFTRGRRVMRDPAPHSHDSFALLNHYSADWHTEMSLPGCDKAYRSGVHAALGYFEAGDVLHRSDFWRARNRS